MDARIGWGIVGVARTVGSSLRSPAVFPALLLALAALVPTSGRAAELRVLSGGAPQESLAALVPDFEARTGHRLAVTFAVVTELQRRLAAGERADLVLLPVPVIDGLVAAGTLRSEGRATLAVLATSVIVRAGAPLPDVSTPDAFRRALLSARSIVHATPGATPSGTHMARVLDRLGLADVVRGKVIHRPALDGGAALVAGGEAEIGVYPTSEVAHVPGVVIAGPLPEALQLRTVYGAAVASAAASPDAAAAFIAHLADPASRGAWTRAGFEPPAPP